MTDNAPKIEKNVPIPPHGSLGRTTPWPWEQMQVGDSFFVSTAKTDRKKLQSKLGNQGNAYCGRHRPGYRITTRRVPGGVRVWLIEDDRRDRRAHR